MKLEKKKMLASRALGVGKNRIVFDQERLEEIKQAITKQDMKDLHRSGAIMIEEKKGRRKIKKRPTRRRAGSVKKKARDRKREYIISTRKLRKYLKVLKAKGQILTEEYKDLRKEIRARIFRSLAHMKEIIAQRKEEKK
ncbi:hypothetical protein HYV50_06005 [Candidatus Pacearchaeota archaeon]|nr:hypothetical protein [Candidatus Pacearchaeota archaeon]